jgi:dipeptidyl aminopeptidase/acylaminoacyl peptidase
MKRFACLLLLLAPPVAWAQPATRAMTVDDLLRFKRVTDPQISPDGKWVAYAVGNVDMEGNRLVYNLWLASTEKPGLRKQLTAAKKSDRHPRWSPDGKSLLFESSRSGTNQLWIIEPDAGEARQLTKISTGAGTGIWSRDGRHIAFVSAVWPEFSEKPFADSDALNHKRMQEREKNPVKARVFTRLFFRHWDDYVEDKRQHLFVMPYDKAKAGQPRDVTPGDRDAHPTSSTFSAGDDFTFSPDGKHLYFTAVPAKNEAWSTDYNVCRVPVTGGTKKWESLTAKNAAADGAPQFSPDGKWLAYRAQKRAGFEADRWDIYLLPADAKPDDKAPPRNLTAEFDETTDSFVWLPDSETIYLASPDRAKTRYFATTLKSGGAARLTFISHHDNNSLSVSGDGKHMAFLRSGLTFPPEVFACADVGVDFNVRNVSAANVKLLAELNLPEPEEVRVIGAAGTPMQMWILKPPGFDARKRWPLAFLVHGGPQGAWEDGWSFRWNPQAWAARGYVVALPNPRGSTGFGQQYTDEISGDWGGKCYEDLMAGLAYLEKQPWIDTERMAAAGASFGGYMMNWFQGNTTKFKTLITHCGVYNFDSMYATTEELWFDEWEHGGLPWGKSRDAYDKHSPHRLAKNFKTPMLIIHNDRDYRVPVSEGIQLFTTLQRLGVPSRFINFPDEGHWVLKPQNSRYWHREVFAWLEKQVPPGGR